jgi:hypothetical protein
MKRDKKGVVLSRSSSTSILTNGFKANGRKRLQSPCTEPPKKRQRIELDVYDFDETDDIGQSSLRRARSRKLISVQPKSSTKKSSSITDVTTPTRIPNRKSIPLKQSTQSPHPSDSSNDPLLTPINLSRPSNPKPKKTNSSVKSTSIVNNLPSPIPTATRTFTEKLQEGAASSKRDRKEKKFLNKDPTEQELESVRAQVLGKLCGRIQIPLQGDSAGVAT